VYSRKDSCLELHSNKNNRENIMDENTISLRPMALRPGGGVNPFAGFGKGAGVNLKNKVCYKRKSLSTKIEQDDHLLSPVLPQAQLGTVKDERKKPRSDVIKYTREFMMSLAEVSFHLRRLPEMLCRQQSRKPNWKNTSHPSFFISTITITLLLPPLSPPYD